MKALWRSGNSVRLLENGEEYFPRVFEAIAQAKLEVLVETFILFDDPVGRQLQAVLIAAAKRGVRVELTVDGHGSAYLPDTFIGAMTGAGVRYHVFGPQRLVFGVRTNPLRRLHRKLTVIDGTIAFVGGINFSFDHVRDFGVMAKQDYAVEVRGPVVADVHRLLERTAGPVPVSRMRRWWRRWRPEALPQPAPAGPTRCALVTRDNHRHRNDIERHYREAIRAARRDIVIANAYFFPGYRLLRELRDAARRGVRVRLILQGHPDMPLVKWLEATLYDILLRAGIEIHEYCERPLHGKVAVMDDAWATVGSSNLDPPSLSLNLESNLVIQDRHFNAVLRDRLEHLMRNACRRVEPTAARSRTLWRRVLTALAFHAARKVPGWISALPASAPVTAVIAPGETVPETRAEMPAKDEPRLKTGTRG
ncbi:MAG TPA: cardiolipin synthase ClsB [Candidatus Binatia bacterium]|nr:cardiolipin synthase ClsB [Candidatus Binatia bacterium]